MACCLPRKGVHCGRTGAVVVLLLGDDVWRRGRVRCVYRGSLMLVGGVSWFVAQVLLNSGCDVGRVTEMGRWVALV